MSIHPRAALAAPSWSVALDTAIRYFGWAAEWTGLFILAHGLSETRRAFAPERLSFLEQVQGTTRSWLRTLRRRLANLWHRLRWPGRSRPPHNITLSVSDSANAVDSVGSLVLRQTLPSVVEGADLDQRVGALEGQLRQIEGRLHNTLEALQAEAASRGEGDRDERAARDEAMAHLEVRIHDLAAGGLRIEAWGLAFLVVGSVCTAVPDGLATFVRLVSPL